MNALPTKKSIEGKALLNVACGTRTNAEWTNVDFSPYARLVKCPWLVSIMKTAGVLSEERARRLDEIDRDLICWDLRRGIPFADSAFDAVYHSHFLEHIDRDAAPAFLAECRRVLKTGGIIRVVIPDLRYLVDRYDESFRAVDKSGGAAFSAHQRAISEIFDQMVRTQAFGTANQRPVVRALERVVRGDAEKTGERHRWMYDRHTLGRLLLDAGFRDVICQSAGRSRIPGWDRFLLDVNRDGSVYKPESLFMEGLR